MKTLGWMYIVGVALLLSVGCGSGDRVDDAPPTPEVDAETPPESPVGTAKPPEWPTGSDTPEGAACDLARAFIECDSQLFEAVCVRSLGGGESKSQYDSFRANMVKQISAAATDASLAAKGPKEIVGVFASRHLSLNGPASYGYAIFGFNDVRFVDVETRLGNDKVFECRTLVLHDTDGKWYVLPCPNVYELLSMGLNDESQSTERWTGENSNGT